MGGAGKAIANLNPFKKGDTYDAQNVADAEKIEGPKLDDYRNTDVIIGGPDTYKGAQIKDVTGPTAATINQAPQAEFRGQQMTLAKQLSDQSMGRGPSLATEQFNQAQKANQAAAFAQMASQRGGPSAMGARNTQMAVQGIQAQTARDAAMGRIQEQMTARQQLGSVLDQGRGQDISLATSQAQMQQDSELARYKGQIDVAIQQGQLDQQTASEMFANATRKSIRQAELNQESARLFNDLQAKYKGMGMDAAEANRRAAMDVAAARRLEEQKAQESEIAASAAQQKLIVDTAAAVATGGASLAAPVATGMIQSYMAPSPAAAPAPQGGGSLAPNQDGTYTTTTGQSRQGYN